MISSVHCSHSKNLNDGKNTIYCCDECASKFIDALKTSHNNARVKCTLYAFNADCKLNFGCCCGDHPCLISYEYTSHVA